MFLYPDFQLLDAAGPVTAFEIAGRIAPDAYRMTVLPIAGGAVRSSSGIAIDTDPVAGASPVDTIVVVGGEDSRAAMRCEHRLAVSCRRQGAAHMQRLLGGVPARRCRSTRRASGNDALASRRTAPASISERPGRARPHPCT
ncbi:hypothetical protein [Sphingomonas carotinifaciens]|uniref:hypothetical protein n=1 Tax=Sphingomonas carotinifaciens TaxID=1166323 RepID=UPI001F41B219|nr:hypothetical protein [Sphingomonas carotinifaciens]